MYLLVGGMRKVKLDHLRRDRGKNKQFLKPPLRLSLQTIKYYDVFFGIYMLNFRG